MQERHIAVTFSVWAVVCGLWCVGCECKTFCQKVNNYLSFEKLKFNWNQTWVIDATWEPSYVNEVKGHLKSSCKIGGKCQIGLI